MRNAELNSKSKLRYPLCIAFILFTALAEAREIGKSEVESAVRGFILANSGWNNGDVTVRDMEFKGGMNVDGEEVEFEIIPLNKGLFLGKTPLLVKVKAGREVKHSFWITPFVEVTADVPSAKGLLRKGQMIKSEDIAVDKKNLSVMPKNVILDPNDIIEKVAKRDIKPGAVIEADMLELRKLVRRGAPVIIVAESGLLRVSAAGQAKEDGGKGSFIKVLNLSSKKVIVGKIVADSTVSVHF